MSTTNYTYLGKFAPNSFYPVFDPTGTAVNNLVSGEVHTLTASSDPDYHVIVPLFAPFFRTGFKVVYKAFNSTTTITLEEGKDYVYVYQFIGATRGCAKPIFGGIAITNYQLAGEFTLVYQTLGGDWCVNLTKINEVLANIIQNPRVTSWEQVVQLPSVFPVLDHQWNLTDLVGASEIVKAIDEISGAIRDSVTDSTDLNELRVILEATIEELETKVHTYFANNITSLANIDIQLISNKLNLLGIESNLTNVNTVLNDKINALKELTNNQLQKLKEEININMLNASAVNVNAISSLSNIVIKNLREFDDDFTEELKSVNSQLDSIRTSIENKVYDLRNYVNLSVKKILEELETTLKTSIKNLATVATWNQETLSEFLRGNGQSGVYLTNNSTLNGPDARFRSFTESFNPIGMFNKNTVANTVGYGEFSFIINGFYMKNNRTDYTQITNEPGLVTVSAPGLPSHITGTVSEQITKMTSLFSDFNSGNLPSGFRWNLNYLEVWLEPMIDTSAISISSLNDAIRSLQFYHLSGYTGEKGCTIMEPPVVRINSGGETIFCKLNYRFRTTVLPDSLDPRNHIELTDNSFIKQSQGRPTKRYRVKENIGTDLNYLDSIMGLVYGYGVNNKAATESYITNNIPVNLVNPVNGNQYTYSRYYNREVIGQDSQLTSRGYNDPYLFVALSDNPNIQEIDFNGEKYRYSYAIPLEIVLRTPLEVWNPYNITEMPSLTPNKLKETSSNPYEGYSKTSGTFFMTPASMFNLSAYKTYNEVGKEITYPSYYVLGGDGNPYHVIPSGIYDVLPYMNNVGSIRTRYAIYPVYHEGSFHHAQTLALRNDVLAMNSSLLTSIANINDSNMKKLFVY